ncbi:MAG: tetratricopeptide repeat protein [Elusimicrobia bacterium]|nr:tetratricopeptide repeat protein [Elusimicrobiota bacterium]
MKNRALLLLLLLTAAPATPSEPDSAAPPVEVSTAGVQNNRGFRLDQNPQAELAAEVLREGVERFPQNAVLLKYWELFSGKTGEENLQPLSSDNAGPDQIQEALLYLDSRLKSGKPNPELLRIAGLLNRSLGQTDQAEQAFTRLLEISPKDVGAHFMLALIYEKKKLREKAIDAWSQCLTLSGSPKLQIIANKHIQQLQQAGP